MFSFIIPSLCNLQLRRQFSIHITVFALVKNDLPQHLCEERERKEREKKRELRNNEMPLL